MRTMGRFFRRTVRAETQHSECKERTQADYFVVAT